MSNVTDPNESRVFWNTREVAGFADPANSVSNRFEPIRFPHIPARERPTPPQAMVMPDGTKARLDAGHVACVALPESPDFSETRTFENRDGSTQRAEHASGPFLHQRLCRQIERSLRRGGITPNGSSSNYEEPWTGAFGVSPGATRSATWNRLGILKEMLRRQLIELGHGLIPMCGSEADLLQQFTALCSTFAEISQEMSALQMETCARDP